MLSLTARTVATIATAAALVQPAYAASPFCTAFETVVKAAMEPVEYGSIRGGPAKFDKQKISSKILLPGFDRCEITASLHQFECFTPKATAEKAAAFQTAFKADIETCLGAKMQRTYDFGPLETWMLSDGPNSYPLLLLTKIENVLSFTFRFKGLRG